jgi:hypothetical protein
MSITWQIDEATEQDRELVDDQNCFCCGRSIGYVLMDDRYGIAYRPVFVGYAIADGQKVCEYCGDQCEEARS